MPGYKKKCSSKCRRQRKNNLENKKKEENQDPDEDQDSESPFKVKESEILGRHLVASKPLRPGEVILVDEAIAVGPCQESKPLCIGCYVDIDLKDPRTYQRCTDCSWPLCAQNCSGRHKKNGHSREECDFFSKSAIGDKGIDSFENFYYALTPFRCLILQENDPEKWEIVKGMEGHTEERRKVPELWKANQEMAVRVIREEWCLPRFEEEEIHFVCGALEVNAFEINRLDDPGAQCLRAIYPKAFLFSHDCVPNTCHSNGEEFQMVFRTITSVPENDLITVSYAYTFQPTLKRREHLEKTKFFSCQCKRCSDPTELGTHVGAMRCRICPDGLVLPTNPLVNDSAWKCNSPECKFEIQVSQIIPLLDSLFNELDSINGNDIIGYEKFLEKCKGIFHENHYLCLSAMHCLSQIYGKINGYLINDLTEYQLKRKIEICKKLIKIFEALEPGLSKQRGILLYELHAPLMVLFRKEMENQILSPKEAKVKLKEIFKCLEESRLILSKEPENSIERQMVRAAEEAIASLKGKQD